jgi:hypothetical protein
MCEKNDETRKYVLIDKRRNRNRKVFGGLSEKYLEKNQKKNPKK